MAESATAVCTAGYGRCVRPGDRINLIRRLADHLLADHLPVEDRELILRQLGFPAGDWQFYEGTFRSYILEVLERGSDEALVELDEYLLGGSSRERLDPADLPWASGTYRLFISHTHANAALAEEVKAIFGRWRVDAFVAHTTIEPTREWQRAIEAALDSCEALAVFLTDDFLESKWCDQEVGYCIARHIPIVPVRLGPDPHGFIGKYQAATPEHDGAPWVADAMFRALSRNAAARDAMAAPVVHRYAATSSLDGARRNFALMQDVPDDAWTPELVEVVERAAEFNNQIERAVAVEGPFTGEMPEATARFLAPIRERLGMNASFEPIAADDDIPF